MKCTRQAYLSAYLSKIDGPTIDLPVTEAGGIGAAATADFGGRVRFGLRLSALFCFGKGALGGGRERLTRGFTGFSVYFIVVICGLHGLERPPKY